jgi:hypothetical protein
MDWPDAKGTYVLIAFLPTITAAVRAIYFTRNANRRFGGFKNKFFNGLMALRPGNVF